MVMPQVSYGAEGQIMPNGHPDHIVLHGVIQRRWQYRDLFPHRDSGPAYEFSDGSKVWFQGGERIYSETGTLARDPAGFPGYDGFPAQRDRR